MTDAELAMLEQILRREAFPGAHLEVGTAAGGTLCRMLACLPRERRFVVVDRMQYYDGQLASFERNLERHGIDRARVDLRVASSARAFREAAARGERFDFALIDAGHTLADVTRDLRFARLVRDGGIVCLHDCDDRLSHRGVRVAVRRFERRRPEYERIAQVDTLVALRKRCAPRRREVDAFDVAHAALLALPLRVLRTAGKLAKRWRRRRARG